MILWVVAETPVRCRTTDFAPGYHVATMMPVAISLLAPVLRVEAGAEIKFIAPFFAPHERHCQ